MEQPAPRHWPIEQAARALHRGAVLAYPTEGVWGLGCDPAREDTLSRLLALKQRPWRKGLILIASDWSQLAPWLAVEEPPAACAALWPGHVTCLLPARPEVCPLLRGEHPNLAVRISAHPPVRALCEAFGGAIVSTSANRAGRPTPGSLTRLRAQFGPAVDHYLNAPLGQARGPSRIMDPFTGRQLRA